MILIRFGLSRLTHRLVRKCAASILHTVPGEATVERLRAAWSEHLILLFRQQGHITEAEHIRATGVFGTPVAGANKAYF